MAEKKMEEAVVVSQEEIASGIFSMWIHVPEISALAGPGQFCQPVLQGCQQTASKAHQYL